jgi:glycosyltransferase involved in cell wall biosynthesis
MKGNLGPLKVCFITAFPPQKKGEAEYAYDYISAFLENNLHQVYFYVISQKAYEKTKEYRQPLSNACVKVERIFNPNSLIDRNLGFLKIFSRICQIRPDIVHLTYGPNTDYGGRIGEPLLLLFLGLKIMRIPIIVTLHSTWLPNDVKNRAMELGHSKFFAKIAMAYTSIFTKIFTHLTDKVLLLVTVEKSPITVLYAGAYGLPQNKIGEEPHGCKFDPISTIEKRRAKAKIGLEEDKKIVLSFGFIREDKGFEYLIDAFSRISKKNCLLVIAGSPRSNEDKVYLNSLMELSESLGIKDKVIFDLRYVPDNELKGYIDAADVIVFPYLRSVGASGPLHYAISRGKPVIATGIGYMSTMKNIIVLVHPKDSMGLANAISKLLTDRGFTEKIKTRELEYAKAHDWTRVIGLNLDVYRTVIKSKHLG